MIKRIKYLWRVVATGGCFALFYSCSIVLITVVLPVLYLLARNRATRIRYLRWIIRNSFVLFLRIIVFARILRISVQGAEQLKKSGPRVVIANHPSYLDIVILLSLVPNASCIVNGNLLSNFVIGKIVTSAGFIRADTSSEQVIADCVTALHQGSSVIVFPEGTRSVPGKPLRFHRGFAHISLLSGAEIQPVVIHCEPPILVKGVPWHRIPEQPTQFRIDIKEPLKATAIVPAHEPSALASRTLEEHLEHYYSKEIRIHEHGT